MPGSAEVIYEALRRILPQEGVTELRILGTSRGVVSGYFDDYRRLAQYADQWDGLAEGIYFTPNPVIPDLIARAANRYKEFARHTTSDEHIVSRRFFLVDFDPNRPAGISSTETEHEAALQRAWECHNWMIVEGFAEESLILADSGNGAHILVRVDLRNDAESRLLLEKCLKALSLVFDDDKVHIDQQTTNAARIWKLYGTLARKGDDTPDRPHRRSMLLKAGDQLAVAPHSILDALASRYPQNPLPFDRYSTSNFDVETWITDHELSVARKAEWQGGRKWVLAQCPWDSNHADRSAYIVQFPSGALAAGCHHNGCADRDWQALRDEVEPGWRRRSDVSGSSALTFHHNTTRSTSEKVWPEPPGGAAFHGLAGRIVETVDPYTEADKVAVLAHLLAAFGVAVGPTPHFMVGATRHSARLFFTVVGRTSKSRKGDSWQPVRALFDGAEQLLQVRDGLASGEGLIWAVRDAIEKTAPIRKKGIIVGYQSEIIDKGESDKRLLVLEPEYARVLKVMGRQGNTLSPVIRAAWDSGSLGNMTKNSPAKASNTHIGIVGHITVEELRRELPDIEGANGFANRFIWLLATRSKELPSPGVFSGREVDSVSSLLADAINTASTIERMSRDDEAGELWASIYHDLSFERDGLAGGILARSEANVLRLSILYALLDGSDRVRVPHLAAAEELWRYAERCVDYIFGEASGDPVADTILQALRTTGEINRTQISGLFARHESPDRIANALSSLASRGLAEPKTRSTRGRPEEVWRVVRD